MSIDFSSDGGFETEEPLVATSLLREDEGEYSLRPQTLSEYIGQQKAKGNLSIFIEAAKMRKEPLDHVLLHGPPGLGKTTLSGIIANEMGVNIRITSGPAIEKPGDLAALLTNLNENDILFVDEIHRLNRSVEEILYPAMEDYAIDIIVGKGPSANSIRLDLPKFTLIGATTRAGQLSAPLRDRFGVTLRLELYTPEELETILEKNPVYFPTQIPAGTYPGQEETVDTFGVKCLLCVSSSMPEDLAYQLTQAIWNVSGRMGDYSPAMDDMAQPDFLCQDLPIPLHPGAERFYQEAGAL